MAKYKIIPSSRTIVQSPISIGHKAEKGVEAIEFDLTAWVETYGSGTLTVIMRRWGDAIPYPIALEIDENNKATWTLSDIDTAKAGMAYAQLNYIVGDEVVKKSDIYTFRVMDSLTGEGDPPEAYESWLEQLTHLAAEAMAEVLDIEGIVTDKTLTIDGGIADAKSTGDALALKADKSTTYTKTEVDQMIEDVEVETDTTLSVSGAPADAKKTGDELSALKADLDAQTGVISLIKDYYIKTSDTPINITPISSSIGRMCAVVDCTAGDKFVINAYSDSTQAVTWCFIDSANNAISMAEAQVDATDLELTAPNNAAKLIINDMRGGMSYKVGNNLATKASNGLSDDVKEALINCFAKVAWSDTEGRECYNALLSAFHVIDFYDKFEWVYSNGDIVKLNGTLSITNGILKSGTGSPYINSMRLFCVTKGKATEIQNTSPAAYLIPVPKTANNVSVSVVASTIYIRCSVYRYDPTTGKYELVFGTSWAQGSISKAFTAENNLYLAILLKATSDGETAFVNEPTEVTAIFTED